MYNSCKSIQEHISTEITLATYRQIRTIKLEVFQSASLIIMTDADDFIVIKLISNTIGFIPV